MTFFCIFLAVHAVFSLSGWLFSIHMWKKALDGWAETNDALEEALEEIGRLEALHCGPDSAA